jgi:hypothetical protein
MFRATGRSTDVNQQVQADGGNPEGRAQLTIIINAPKVSCLDAAGCVKKSAERNPKGVTSTLVPYT